MKNLKPVITGLKNGIQSSMSHKGDCWDNAVAESFFSTIKTELIYHNKYQDRKQAKRDIFQYIEVYYNKIKLHSTLDYKSPSFTGLYLIIKYNTSM